MSPKKIAFVCFVTVLFVLVERCAGRTWVDVVNPSAFYPSILDLSLAKFVIEVDPFSPPSAKIENPTLAPSSQLAPTSSPNMRNHITPAPSQRPTVTQSETPTALYDRILDNGGCALGESLYELNMYDNWGDGWSGTKISVYWNKPKRMETNSTVVLFETFETNSASNTLTATEDYKQIVYEGGLMKEQAGHQYLCLSSRYCYHVDVQGGNWPQEVRWDIMYTPVGVPADQRDPTTSAVAEGGVPSFCQFSVPDSSTGRQVCPYSCYSESSVSSAPPSSTPVDSSSAYPTRPSVVPTISVAPSQTISGISSSYPSATSVTSIPSSLTVADPTNGSIPSNADSSNPSDVPSDFPSLAPSFAPSLSPSNVASFYPTYKSGYARVPPSFSFSPSTKPTSSKSPANFAISKTPTIAPVAFIISDQIPSHKPSLPPQIRPTIRPSFLSSQPPSVTSPRSKRPSDMPSLGPQAMQTISPVEATIPIKATDSTPSRAPGYFPSHTPSKVIQTTSAPLATKHFTSIPVKEPPVSPPSNPPSTGEPTLVKTGHPSEPPSLSPSSMPVQSPSPPPIKTRHPVLSPTLGPSLSPSVHPSSGPTLPPLKTRHPVAAPTEGPSGSPSTRPSANPTLPPVKTRHPVAAPTEVPSSPPSPAPAKIPTLPPVKTRHPVFSPTVRPSDVPTTSPSEFTGARVRLSNPPTEPGQVASHDNQAREFVSPYTHLRSPRPTPPKAPGTASPTDSPQVTSLSSVPSDAPSLIPTSRQDSRLL